MEKVSKNHKTYFYEILHMKQKIISFAISVVIMMVLLPDTFAFSESIKWYSHDEGMALGRSEEKKIYINFRADWCSACKHMEKKTFSDSVVIAYLNKYFISIKVDTDKETKISNTYRVSAIPDNWFLFKNGDPIGHSKGSIPPDIFMKILKSVQKGAGEKKQD